MAKILITIVIPYLLSQCILSCKNRGISGNQYQGYISLKNKAFEDVDSLGYPVREFRGNDSAFLSVGKIIFIWENYLMDVELRDQFVDGAYIRTDTVAYVFYDLIRQKVAKFEDLTSDSRVISTSEMTMDGSFSKAIEYDPMNGIPDSTWKTRVIQLDARKNTIVEFLTLNNSDSYFAKRAKFWIDPEIRDFPLQMSYILSKKNNGGFVYKMQLPFPEGKSVMETSINYHPARLPDSLIRIFKKWVEKFNY